MDLKEYCSLTRFYLEITVKSSTISDSKQGSQYSKKIKTMAKATRDLEQEESAKVPQ